MKETEPSFEQAYSELEETVGKLEQGGLTLEESLALYERGVELSTLCGKKLDEAELQVRKLQESALDQLEAVSFEAEGD